MNPKINVVGLLWILIIMIPNIVFACTNKDGFISQYQNKLADHLEQIGRFGCFFCMIVMFPQFQTRWIPSEGAMDHTLERDIGSEVIALINPSIDPVFVMRDPARISFAGDL